MTQLIYAVGAGVQSHPLAKIFFEQIWAKIGKIKVNFRQV